MARTLFLLLDPATLPDAAALQASLKTLKLGLKLDGAWAPQGAGGYLPFILQGEDAGVYLSFAPGAGLPAAAAALAGEVGARRHGVTIKWGGDAREELAAQALAAALVEGHGALAVDPDSGQARTASVLLGRARALHAEMF